MAQHATPDGHFQIKLGFAMALLLPPAVSATLDALKEVGCSIVNTGPKKMTYRVKYDNRDYGYVNGQILKLGAVLGYHFQDPPHRGSDACPQSRYSHLALSQELATRYGCSVEDFLEYTSQGANAGRLFVCILSPTVALQIVQRDAGMTQDESGDRVIVKVGLKFVEGRLIETRMTRRERDPKARVACLEAHGFDCFVCGENLRALYAGLSTEVIHVHHEEPLSEATGQREFDAVSSMKPLCPNCHCVLHSRRPAYTLTELRRMRCGQS
jgi:hypothetical protein